MKELSFQNIFLNEVRRNNIIVNIQLANGTNISCYIQCYDNETITVNTDNAQIMIYKSSITSIVSKYQIIKY